MWVRVLKEKYGVERGVVKQGGRVKLGWWKDFHNLEKEELGFRRWWFSTGLKKEMGNISKIYLWSDVWLDGAPLKMRFERLYSVSLDKEGLVSYLVGWREGVIDWRWRWRWRRGLF